MKHPLPINESEYNCAICDKVLDAKITICPRCETKHSSYDYYDCDLCLTKDCKKKCEEEL